jgi:hypothetical protein
MTCDDFRRWLDGGGVSGPGPLAHAARCRRCEALLRAARAVHEGLAAASGSEAPAPAGFADRVMARVAAADAARRRAAPALVRDPIAWWVRAAAEPATALALLAAGLLAWNWDALWRAARDATALRVETAAGAPGLALGLLPVVLLGSAWLYRATQSWVVPRYTISSSGARRIAPARSASS